MQRGMIRVSLFAAGLALLWSVSARADDLADFYRNYEVSRTHLPNSEHQVPRGGYHIHANEYAPESPVQGAPLILMHGFPDSSHLYDRLAPLLAKNRRVISFDFLGWGKSDTPQDHVYNAASLRSDLEAVIDYFQLASIVVVVHDSSGLPGIDWALAHPERTEGLVLLNTVYAPSEYTVPPPVIKTLGTPGLFSRGPLALGIRMSVTRFQKGLHDQVSDFFARDDMRAIYANIFSHQASAIRPAFLGLTEVFFGEVETRAQRLPELRKLGIPTKIVFGAEDPFLNAALAREFDTIFPVSQLYLIENAGHYVQLDQPEAVAEAIQAAWPKKAEHAPVEVSSAGQ